MRFFNLVIDFSISTQLVIIILFLINVNAIILHKQNIIPSVPSNIVVFYLIFNDFFDIMNTYLSNLHINKLMHLILHLTQN